MFVQIQLYFNRNVRPFTARTTTVTCIHVLLAAEGGSIEPVEPPLAQGLKVTVLFKGQCLKTMNFILYKLQVVHLCNLQYIVMTCFVSFFVVVLLSFVNISQVIGQQIVSLNCTVWLAADW